MKHEVEKLRKQIKQYKRDHEAMMETMGAGGRTRKAKKLYLLFFFSLGVAALSKPLAAFSEVGLPAHLQPVEKADKVRWFVLKVGFLIGNVRTS